MRIAFYKSIKGYETALGPALVAGAARHGDEVVIRDLDGFTEPEGDIGMIIGVVRREVLWAYQRAGIPLIYVDKGFIRRRAHYNGANLPEFFRMCWNDPHPSAAQLMARYYPHDRMKAAHVEMHERRAGGDHILILGSSEKYHHTMQLPHPTEWAQALVAKIRRYSDAPIIWRPKPSWKWAVPVDGTEFDHGGKTPAEVALQRSFIAITYGSIAGVDSICYGVPCISLGNCVASPMGDTALTRYALSSPYWPSLSVRLQWMANLCYFQWRPTEIEDGTAWAHLKEQMP